MKMKFAYLAFVPLARLVIFTNFIFNLYKEDTRGGPVAFV